MVQHRVKRNLAAIAAAALVAACAGGDEASDAGVPAPAPQPEPSQAAADDTTGRLIRDDGIGAVRAGMTIGQLRAALPPGHTLEPPGPFMVDIDALPVVHDGDTLYAVLIVTGESAADDAAINLVATMNPSFRTAAGIGPGSTLAEGAAAYGPPTLSYNTEDESREYAVYPRAPQRLRFRVGPADDTSTFAGVYAGETGYVETTRYDPRARITMVLIHTR